MNSKEFKIIRGEIKNIKQEIEPLKWLLALGLVKNKDVKTEEVGKAMGLTRNRISQMFPQMKKAGGEKNAKKK